MSSTQSITGLKWYRFEAGKITLPEFLSANNSPQLKSFIQEDGSTIYLFSGESLISDSIQVKDNIITQMDYAPIVIINLKDFINQYGQPEKSQPSGLIPGAVIHNFPQLHLALTSDRNGIIIRATQYPQDYKLTVQAVAVASPSPAKTTTISPILTIPFVLLFLGIILLLIFKRRSRLV